MNKEVTHNSRLFFFGCSPLQQWRGFFVSKNYLPIYLTYPTYLATVLLRPPNASHLSFSLPPTLLFFLPLYTLHIILPLLTTYPPLYFFLLSLPYTAPTYYLILFYITSLYLLSTSPISSILFFFYVME